MEPSLQWAFDSFLEALPLGAFQVDDSRLVSAWNRAAEKMQGWRRAEVIGRRIPGVPEETWPDLELAIQRASGPECLAEMTALK
jgi:PAS domain S-box-containing protein